MSVPTDFKAILEAALQPLHTQLIDQSRDMGDLTRSYKTFVTNTREQMEDLTTATTRLTQGLTAVSQAIDKLSERLAVTEAALEEVQIATVTASKAADPLATASRTPTVGTPPEWLKVPRKDLAALPPPATYKLSHLLGVAPDLLKNPSTSADFATDLSFHASGKNTKLIVKALCRQRGNENGYNPETAAVKCVALACADIAENTQGLTGSDLLLKHPHVILISILAASPALRSRLSPELRKKVETLAVFTTDTSKAVVAEVDRELYSTPEQLLDHQQGSEDIPRFAQRFQMTLSLLTNPPDDPQNKFMTLVNQKDRDTFNYVFNKKYANFAAFVTELLSAYNASKAISGNRRADNAEPARQPVQLYAAAVERPARIASAAPPASSTAVSAAVSARSAAAPRLKVDSHRHRERSADRSSRQNKKTNTSKYGAKNYKGRKSRRESIDSDRSSSRGSDSSRGSASPHRRQRYDCPVCESDDHDADTCDAITERFKQDNNCDCPIEGHQYHKLRECRVLTNLGVRLPKSRERKGNDRARSSKGRMKESKQRKERKQRNDSSSGSGSDSE